MSDLWKLKKKAYQFKREIDKSEGASQNLMQRLKDEFGVKSLEEAHALAQSLAQSISKRSSQVREILNEYEERYGERI